MFLVRAGECLSPNFSGLVSRLMGLLFLVAWENVEVMERFLWKLYPPAEDWKITRIKLHWNKQWTLGAVKKN